MSRLFVVGGTGGQRGRVERHEHCVRFGKEVRHPAPLVSIEMPDPAYRTHHLHLVPVDSPRYRGELAFAIASAPIPGLPPTTPP